MDEFGVSRVSGATMASVFFENEAAVAYSVTSVLYVVMVIKYADANTRVML